MKKEFEEEPLDKISKALGASRQIKLSKYSHGPLGWLHMAHDVSRLKELQDAIQTNAGQACDMLDGPCPCGVGHKSSKQSNTENIETKLCQMFKKVLNDIDTLWFMFSIYVGERQIARGDVITHKELVRRFKRLKEKHDKRMAQ